MTEVSGRELARVLAVAGSFRRERRSGEAAARRAGAAVRLTSGGGTLLVRASSQGGDVTLPVPASSEDLWDAAPFDVRVELGVVQQVARRAQTLSLGVRGGALLVRAGGGTLELPVGAPDEDAPWPDLSEVGRLSAGSLLGALLHVRNARPEAGHDAARLLGAWRGVLLDGNGGALRVVAGGPHGLAIQATAYRGAALRLLLPPGELGGVCAVLASEGEGDVTLLADAEGSRAELRGARGWVRLSLLDHRAYPQYQQVIPKGCDVSVRMDGAVLRRALRQVQPLAERARHTVHLTVSEGRVTLEGQSEFGRARAEVQAETSGVGAAAFNLPLLSQMIAVDGALNLRLSEGRPALITQGAYAAVFSPLRSGA